MDRDPELITAASVTPASTHDSREVAGLVGEGDRELWADSAYSGDKVAKAIREASEGIKLHICEKGSKDSPLTDAQKASNTLKAKARCRAGHVFAHMANSMGGMLVRSIGIARAAAQFTLKSLAYNMARAEFLARPKPAEAAQ